MVSYFLSQTQDSTIDLPASSHGGTPFHSAISLGKVLPWPGRTTSPCCYTVFDLSVSRRHPDSCGTSFDLAEGCSGVG